MQVCDNVVVAGIESVDRSALEDLGRALWRGHAAALIGTGFSRDAVPNSEQTPPIALWGDLIKDMQDALGEQKETNVLTLADMYCASFKRPRLEEFLERHVPSASYAPGELHKSLMKLPWTDVFTTNYDTLLEDTASMIMRRYDVVRVKEDIPVTASPRIVKLHGTFRLARPLVFTGEDYRVYPQQSAAFVNLVQQSMLENVFCLLGFSGDDINFQKWVGWVRDNLSDYRQPVYICGILNVTPARRKLWAERGIIPIDLAQAFPREKWASEDQRQRDALEWLLLNLWGLKPLPPEIWPHTERRCPVTLKPNMPELYFGQGKALTAGENAAKPEKMYSRPQTMEEYIGRLRELKASYPGWLIAPQAARDLLAVEYDFPWSHTGYHQCEDKMLKLDFLYEQAWVMGVSLRSLADDLALNAEKLLAELEDWTGLSASPKEKCMELALLLLRYYRVGNEAEKFQRLSDKLAFCLSEGSSQHSRYCYEQMIYALQRQDYAALRKWQEMWRMPQPDDFWALQKAAILAEAGKPEPAIRLVQDFIRAVKLKITRTMGTGTTDYYLLSIYGWALLLYKIIRDGFAELTDMRDFDPQEEMDRLERYQASPYQRLREFARQKLPTQADEERESLANDFEADRVVFNARFGRSQAEENLMQLLCLFEEAPLPLVCGRERVLPGDVDTVLKSGIGLREEMLAPLLVRLNNQELVKAYYKPVRVLYMEQDKASQLAQTTLGRAQELVRQSEGLAGAYSREALHNQLELLSRLAFRLDREQLNRLLEWLMHVFRQQTIFRTDIKLMQVLGTAFERVLAAMEPQEILNHLERLARLPLEVVSVGGYWPEPMESLVNAGTEFYGQVPDKQGRWCNAIDWLLLKFAKGGAAERQHACISLMFFYDFGSMTEAQKNSYGQGIWRDAGDGLPKDLPAYPEHFLRLPSPEGIDVKERVKEHIEKSDFGEKDRAFHSLSVSRHPIYAYARLCLGSVTPLSRKPGLDYSYCLDWGEREAGDYLTKACRAWKAFRELRYEREPFLQSELYMRQRVMHAFLSALNRLVLPYAGAGTELAVSLGEMLEEMEGCGIVTVNVWPGLLYGKLKEQEEVEDGLLNAIRYQEEHRIICVADALLAWLAYTAEDMTPKLDKEMSEGFLTKVMERSVCLDTQGFLVMADMLGRALELGASQAMAVEVKLLASMLERGKDEAQRLANKEYAGKDLPGCSYRFYVMKIVRVAFAVRKYHPQAEKLAQHLAYWLDDFAVHTPLPEVRRAVLADRIIGIKG